jgi:alginate O-acetyltransferase complex protein AlgI
MLFNSLEFLIFFPIVFVLYWFVFQKNKVSRNVFILLVSYFFYGWWDWRFLLLIAFSSTLDFFIGLNIEKSNKQSTKKLLLYASLLVNLGLLGYFKYANFFIDSFSDLMTTIGFQANYSSLQIILPVGISFYTFQTLSYTIDIYRGNLKASKDPIAFFAFVSFFPQLVAGPIERASNLLPQFLESRNFDFEKAKDASRQILWGFFKKMVIADTCARHADFIFNNHDSLPASILILGVVYFAFQIYGDFSGYSDIAIGTARLLGFDLMINFRLPYFSRDIGEFWRRWHISLSTWFRDYLYIPLGGSREGKYRSLLNVIIIFTVSGFWHGANWTFVVWGFLNGIFFLPLLLLNKNRNHLDIVANNSALPSFREFFAMSSTFILVCFTWIFFRAENIIHAFAYISNIFHVSILMSPGNPNLTIQPLYLIPIMLIIEWFNRKKDHQLSIENLPLALRWGMYYILIAFIVQFAQQDVSFIYFQF